RLTRGVTTPHLPWNPLPLSGTRAPPTTPRCDVGRARVPRASALPEAELPRVSCARLPTRSGRAMRGGRCAASQVAVDGALAVVESRRAAAQRRRRCFLRRLAKHAGSICEPALQVVHARESGIPCGGCSTCYVVVRDRML